jgi:hypothetical protein
MSIDLVTGWLDSAVSEAQRLADNAERVASNAAQTLLDVSSGLDDPQDLGDSLERIASHATAMAGDASRLCGQLGETSAALDVVFDEFVFIEDIPEVVAELMSARARFWGD